MANSFELLAQNMRRDKDRKDFLNFHQFKLNSWVHFVNEFVCNDSHALIVILNCLGVLQTVKDDFETVVKVVAHRTEINPQMKLKEAFNHQVPILPHLDEESLFIRL